MLRTDFESEHDAFRELCRSFFEKECVPHTARWEADRVPPGIWSRAEQGDKLGGGAVGGAGGPVHRQGRPLPRGRHMDSFHEL